MSEFFSNWTKIVIGMCALIVTVGWTFGFVKTNDLTGVLSVLLGAHAAVSGLNGIIGGPTRNADIKESK